MKKENDELTRLFHSRLENVELPVREGFWENLEQDIPVVLSRRRNIVHRFAAAASVLLILAGASAAFWYFSPKEEIANAFTQVAVSTGTSGKMGADVIHEELPAIQASVTSPVPASSKPATPIEEYPDEESFSVSFSMSISFSSSNNESSDRNSTVGYDRQTSYSNGYENKNTSAEVSEKTVADASVESIKRRTWSLGVFASGGLLKGHSTSQQVPVTTIKYKQPWSAGLSVRKALSDRFGLESGLVYTQLNSEQTAEDDSFSQDQKLHYIGIPVKANLNLYQNKRVNLYASAGGMVEKCVSGHDKPDPLQLSLTAAVGVQCKLNDRLSLYAEPGLSYHFDDGSSVTTIRKEKPLNVNLLCGVRMTY